MSTFFHLQLQRCHSRRDLRWLPRNAVPSSAQLLSCDPASACLQPAQLVLLLKRSYKRPFLTFPTQAHTLPEHFGCALKMRCGGILPSPTAATGPTRGAACTATAGRGLKGDRQRLKSSSSLLGASAACPSRGERRRTRPARLPSPAFRTPAPKTAPKVRTRSAL